jgi:DNA-binding beta-propeller fold protein YncE
LTQPSGENDEEKVVDIKVDGDTLEAMGLDKSSSRLYLNNKAKSQVDVIDREKGTLIASWPVTLAKTNVAMAYDEANHRLFIACRSGGIVVIDTQSGKELFVLPITKGVDDLVFDATSKRLYASCDGDVSVYEQGTPDSYKLLGKVPTGPLARTALLVPQINRYFVAVPQHGTTSAEIMVFEVH